MICYSLPKQMLSKAILNINFFALQFYSPDIDVLKYILWLLAFQCFDIQHIICLWLAWVHWIHFLYAKIIICLSHSFISFFYSNIYHLHFNFIHSIQYFHSHQILSVLSIQFLFQKSFFCSIYSH